MKSGVVLMLVIAGIVSLAGVALRYFDNATAEDPDELFLEHPAWRKH